MLEILLAVLLLILIALLAAGAFVGYRLYQWRDKLRDWAWDGIPQQRAAKSGAPEAGGGVGILAVGEYKVLDGDGNAKYFKTQSGTGASGDAWVPLHSVDDAGGALTVDNGGTFAVQAAQSGTWTVQPGNTANTTAWKVDASSVAVPVTDNSGSLTVDVGTALPAGTNAIGKLAANSGVDIGDVDITSIAAGNNNIGDVDVASIAAGDNNIGNVDLASAIPAGTNNIGDVDVLTAPTLTRASLITLEAAYTAAQTDTAIVTSSAVLHVTQIQAVLDEATTVGVGLRVGFAPTNTPTTTGVVLTHPGLIPGGGISRGDGSADIGVGASGDDLRITCEVPTGGSLRILVSYYEV